MDTVLAVAAVVSLAIALAMGVVLVTMLRQERRRSEARVAALVAMADRAPRAEALRAEAPRARVRSVPDVPRTEAGELELRRPERQVAGVAELFAEPERSSPWVSRLAVAAGLAVVVAAGGYVFLRGGDERAGAAAVQHRDPVAARASLPLELVSLSHAARSGAFSVSGVVQNPAGGAPVARVVATAFALSTDGTVLASGRAPLDFTTLGPGDESPFVVTIPVSEHVARYRVGFRAEDGRVIAHVDRRQAAAVASAGPALAPGEK